MLQSTHKMANLTENEICAVLCSKRQQQHDGENGYVKAGLLNSEIPIQIQTQTFTEHVLLANVRAISCLKNTNHRTRKRQEWGGGGLMKNFLCVNEIKNTTSIIQRSINTTLPKDDILDSKFKSVPLIPCSFSTLLYS